jgi:hypothetical protein
LSFYAFEKLLLDLFRKKAVLLKLVLFSSFKNSWESIIIGRGRYSDFLKRLSIYSDFIRIKVRINFYTGLVSKLDFIGIYSDFIKDFILLVWHMDNMNSSKYHCASNPLSTASRVLFLLSIL